MNSEYFNVYVDDNLVAQRMPLQFALFFVKAIYGEFYAESSLRVTIEKVDDRPDTMEAPEVRGS